MNFKDEALIIYLKIINENNLLVKLLTKNNGLCIGIVYGGNSKRNKVIYQIGSYINFNLLQKNENSIASINGELKKPLLSNYYNDKFKLHGVLTCCSLINIAINENQRFKNIYNQSYNLYLSLNNKHWFYEFSVWMICFLAELGYGFDWTDIKLQKRFLCLDNLQFLDKNNLIVSNNNLIEFPYELVLNKVISFKQCNLLFTIFEHIINKQLLNHSSKKIPSIYFDFKKLILESLK